MCPIKTKWTIRSFHQLQGLFSFVIPAIFAAAAAAIAAVVSFTAVVALVIAGIPSCFDSFATFPLSHLGRHKLSASDGCSR